MIEISYGSSVKEVQGFVKAYDPKLRTTYYVMNDNYDKFVSITNPRHKEQFAEFVVERGVLVKCRCDLQELIETFLLG